MVNSKISGDCLHSYSNFIDKFKKISRNSLLWPKLNVNESKSKIKHDFNEKYSMFSTFSGIRKILQLNMNSSINYDYIDSINLIKLFKLIIENNEEFDPEYLNNNDKIRLLKAKKRLLNNSLFLNKYYNNNNNKEILRRPNINLLFKMIIRFFIYPAYMDIFNYGNLIISR